MIMQLFYPIQDSSISHKKFLDSLMGPLIDWSKGNVVAPEEERDRRLDGL